MSTFKANPSTQGKTNRYMGNYTHNTVDTINEGFYGKNLEFTKYNRYGSRTGMESLMDAPIIDERLKTERLKYGDGLMQLVSLDPNTGRENVDKPINIAGRMHYPNSKGIFNIVDTAYIQRMKDIEDEKREYLDSVIDMCSTSDEICEMTLGLVRGTLDAYMGTKQNAGGVKMSQELVDTDCRPSAMETYAEDSIFYARAAQKFKLIVKQYIPILDELTSKKVINEKIE
jgi:hypothetical protein